MSDVDDNEEEEELPPSSDVVRVLKSSSASAVPLVASFLKPSSAGALASFAGACPLLLWWNVDSFGVNGSGGGQQIKA